MILSPRNRRPKPFNLSPEVQHTAARVEDRVHEWARKRVTKRDWRRTVVCYDSYGTEKSVRVLGRMILTRTGKLAADMHASIRGFRSFGAVPLANETAWVRIGGQEHMVECDRGGIIDMVIPGDYEPGPVEIELWTSDSLVDRATVTIIGEDQRFGIISDIDDTVMVTALPRPMLAAWNTFVLDVHARTPTPGMNVLSERILTSFGRSETPVVYLSTGPWNVAPTLARFLGRNLYPAGPLLLTDWGPTPERIFRSGLEHKVSNLDRLAREFPDIKWILVGDDGQHDEQIYGEFTSRHPDRVLAIAIRQLSTSEAVLAGGRAASAHWRKNAPVPWVYAPDGAGLAKQLTEGGILPDLTQAPDRAPDETR